MEEDSTFVRHEPCPSCGSKDNLARYSDGHGYCFGCNYREHGSDSGVRNYQPRQRQIQMNSDFVDGDYQYLSARNINEDTCKKWDYRVGELGGQPVQIANYKDQVGTRVAQKIRFRNKDFTVRGDMSDIGLYGEHLWSGTGKRAVVCEGEIDAMSISQAQGNQWPVYSVPTGAAGAARAVRKSLELLNGYEEVVFRFDNDEAGVKASRECAQILPPGKARIAKLPLKDANDMLVQNRVQDLVNCLWQSKVFRPDGIVCGTELWDIVSAEDSMASVLYPFTGLNNNETDEDGLFTFEAVECIGACGGAPAMQVNYETVEGLTGDNAINLCNWLKEKQPDIVVADDMQKDFGGVKSFDWAITDNTGATSNAPGFQTLKTTKAKK